MLMGSKSEMKIKILITGVAGFIGYHLTKKYLDNGYSIYGIDNIDNYYDIHIKNKRLKILKKYKNFQFFKIDITKKKKLDFFFNKIKPKLVIHLAAQAGVRYSLENPEKYFSSNILGFFNILDLLKKYQIKKFIFASSSSVYGNTSKLPMVETQPTDTPESFYASTKKANEIMAYSYSKNYNIHTICLRFFTVYGPFGRPDMSLFKFTKSILSKRRINLFNKGNHYRDFTYIDDVVKSIYLVSKKLYLIKKLNYYEIFNIGNSRPIFLKTFLNKLSKILDNKPNIKYALIQKGDVLDTYANTKKIYSFIKFKPLTSIDKGLSHFVKWYNSFYNIKK